MAIRFIDRSATCLKIRVTAGIERLEHFDPNVSEWSHHRNVPFPSAEVGTTKPSTARNGGDKS
jgi:hypothetical protein